MTLTKRIISIVIVIIFILSVILTGVLNEQVVEENNLDLLSPKQTIQVWYTDENLEEYITGVAQAFYDETNIRVITKRESGLEFLDYIYDSTLEGKDYPDVFLTTNDVLEKAYLAGLASEIIDLDKTVTTDNYSQAAINSVKYKDKIIAYPFYFDTSVLLYNKTYLEQQLLELAELATIEKSEEEEQSGTNDPVPESVEELIPDSIDDILIFADNYFNAAEKVESVFKWDVTNIFHNYFFIGDAIQVGGATGDNQEEVAIYNEKAIESMKIYQDLNQFFAIDAKEVSYESVLEEFIEGKIVFSIVTADAIAKIEEAKEKGEFQFEYGIAPAPDVSETIASKSLSVTNSVVINGFTEQKEEANAFAKFLADEEVETLYTRAGKIPAKKEVIFENPKLEIFMVEYEDSIPLTKMIQASNFWLQLEVAFTKIWGGSDANAQLKLLSEQIMTQITGEPFEETVIEELVIEEVGIEEVGIEEVEIEEVE